MLTKDEAIRYINNSPNKLFEVKSISYRVCELCKQPVKYGLEFKIESKHISNIDGLKSRPYVFKNTGKSSHLVKHICSDCYAKLFPEDVIKTEKEEGN